VVHDYLLLRWMQLSGHGHIHETGTYLNRIGNEVRIRVVGGSVHDREARAMRRPDQHPLVDDSISEAAPRLSTDARERIDRAVVVRDGDLALADLHRTHGVDR